MFVRLRLGDSKIASCCSVWKGGFSWLSIGTLFLFPLTPLLASWPSLVDNASTSSSPHVKRNVSHRGSATPTRRPKQDQTPCHQRISCCSWVDLFRPKWGSTRARLGWQARLTRGGCGVGHSQVE
ncbi:hypothetical protein B0T10DRAFT_133441 [Thelonectria olida]|uniref:Uncharacterized protein n=1 Tax=Thelonectria olida TaxID=1576542 RepID=A0A9P8VWZ8_9HYPO|nr:hypothetical protein B0T10DRAFT_133441 [Thelonectria olida]